MDVTQCNFLRNRTDGNVIMLAWKRCTLCVTDVVLRCKEGQLLPAISQTVQDVRNLWNIRNDYAVSFSSCGVSRDLEEIRNASAMTSTSGSVTGTDGGRLAEEDLRQRRRQYAEEVSRMRKKFAQEAKDKAEMKAMAMREARDQQRMKTASREVERKEESVVRQQTAEASKLQLMALKGEERKARAERRKNREAMIEAKRASEQTNLRVTSMEWIEEADLEQKITRALAAPFHL